MPGVVMRPAQVAGLTTLVATPNQFFGLKARLFQNNVQVNQNTFISLVANDGGLVECTYDGYAESAAVTWGEAANGPNGSARAEAPPIVFRCTDATIQQTAYGYYLVTPGVGSAPDVLVKAYNFPTPQGIVVPLDAVVVRPELLLTML